MIELLLFGLAVMVIYTTATPILYLRDKLVILLEGRITFLARLIECGICSCFWIGFVLYFVYPFTPEPLLYAIYLYSIFTIFTVLKNRFI